MRGLHDVDAKGDGPGTTPASITKMTLLIISIPFMALAVAIAVIPLIVLSYREHHRQVAERAARAATAAPMRSADCEAPERLPVAA
jgi:hypothetical protein